MYQGHSFSIIAAGFGVISLILQIPSDSGSGDFISFLSFEKISTAGLLLAAIWYFVKELKKQREEFRQDIANIKQEHEKEKERLNAALIQKDEHIFDLQKEVMHVLKARGE
jgi:ABC-type nickel/cobalt efflux system permease component RcnA